MFIGKLDDLLTPISYSVSKKNTGKSPAFLNNMNCSTPKLVNADKLANPVPNASPNPQIERNTIAAINAAYTRYKITHDRGGIKVDIALGILSFNTLSKTKNITDTVSAISTVGKL